MWSTIFLLRILKYFIYFCVNKKYNIMPIYESGHPVNVANLETLISYNTGYGGQYNPSNALITLANLNSKYSDGVNELAKVNAVLPPWKLALNDRDKLFDPLSTLCTKILNAVMASSVTAEYIKDVKTIIRKLQGKRAVPLKKEPTADSETDTSHSVSQMSFTQRTENLDKLIDLLASNPSYAPNEVEIQVATLTTLRNNMITATTAVKNTYTALSNARIQRDIVLYDLTTGLVKIAEDSKKYVKSVFGATSDQYRQVKALKFTYPNKRR